LAHFALYGLVVSAAPIDLPLAKEQVVPLQ
jgi:hypothetical protein